VDESPDPREIVMIIALLNHKGGVSKTTIALHLACDWAQRGQRVLVIDTAREFPSTSGYTP
jgi:cellulose biosynthesis protein BcsQ